MSANTTNWDEIRANLLADPKVKAAYDSLEPQFSLASQLIALRSATGLTQREFAERVGMKQSQIARIESGKQIPKLETLAKLAEAAGYSVEVHFIPFDSQQAQKIKPLRIAVSDNNSEISPYPANSVRKILADFLESDDPDAIQERNRQKQKSR